MLYLSLVEFVKMEVHPVGNGDSQEARCPFKMPIVRSVASVSKKGASAILETEDSPATVSAIKHTDDEEEGETDATSKTKEISEKQAKKDSFSPAERQKEMESAVPYKEPPWGSITDRKYYFEAIKNGIVVETVDLTKKSFHVFGRLPSCDHSMDHPSLSRYHAVVQYRSVSGSDEPVGWYLYDLDSTHGTWINKQRVKPRVYSRLRVGYVVKFGGSSRLYILHGPDSDKDEESELSVTELKQQREHQKKEMELLQHLKSLEAEEVLRQKQQAADDRGCSWGMDTDDLIEDDEDVNPFSMPEPLNEASYIDDPKKSLRGFFEREGYDLPEYEVTNEAKGRHRCRIELPIDTISGEPEYVEVVQEGKKKDVVEACALEACRVLDRKGLLRQSKHEGRAKKKKNWQDADFYDSDDDTFLDRTGAVEKKREKRIQQIKKSEKADTYESLAIKLNEVSAEMESIEKKLDQDKTDKQAAVDEGLDELDAFMLSMKSGGLDTKTKFHLKHRLVELKQEKLRFERLIAVAQPCKILFVTRSVDSKHADTGSIKKPMTGKMKGANKQTSAFQKPLPRQPPIKPLASVSDANEEVEEEDEEEEVVEKSLIQGRMDSNMQNVDTVSYSTEAELSLKTIAKESANEGSGKSAEVLDSVEDVTHLTMAASTTKKRPVKERHSKESKKHKLSEQSFNEYDENYVMWLPPSGETGDGKTSLNDKFGY